MGRPLLYQKIYDYLKSEIQSGRFKPGERIPTEQALMQMFGVSRMTTNRALQMLTLDGLVTRKAGHGTTVADPNDAVGTQSGRFNGDNLRLGTQPNMIGFVIPRLDDVVGPLLVSSLEQRLHDTDMLLGIGCSCGESESETAIIDKLVQNGARGLIVFPANSEYYNPSILRLHVSGFPIVLVDKQLQGIPLPYVTTDNKEATEALMTHLFGLGHTHIAFYSHDWANVSSLSARFEGYQNSLLSEHIPLRVDYTLTPNRWDHDLGLYNPLHVDEVAQFLVSHPEITAVVATEHQLAEYVFVAAMQLGKTVPRDLSIVCFDGPHHKRPYFSFTRAVQDEGGMAMHALEILMELLGKSTPRTDAVVLPAHIIVGESTAAPRLSIERRKA